MRRTRARTLATRSRAGMTLIEVIVACSLLAITFTSLTAVSVKLAARNRSNAYIEQRTATFFEQVNRIERVLLDHRAIHRVLRAERDAGSGGTR